MDYFWKFFWDNLNVNLVSNALVILVLSLLASSILGRHKEKKEKDELLKKAKHLVVKEIEDNIKGIATMRQSVKDNKVMLMSSPFSTSAFQTVFQGRYIEHLEPEMAGSLFDLLHGYQALNDTSQQLRESYYGISSSLSGIENMRRNYLSVLNKQLNYTERKSQNFLSKFS